MSQFTEAESAFIDGLVEVFRAADESYQAEQRLEAVMKDNEAQIDAVRFESGGPIEIDRLEELTTEAAARGEFSEDSMIVQTTRRALAFGRQIAAAMDEAELASLGKPQFSL